MNNHRTFMSRIIREQLKALTNKDGGKVLLFGVMYDTGKYQHPCHEIDDHEKQLFGADLH